MKLIIVQGETSTGKTTLVRKLAADLKLPYAMKDDYCERRYDELGRLPTLREWKAIDKASWESIHTAIKQAIKDDHILIIEGNFWRKQAKRLRQIVPLEATVVEIFCDANPDVIVKRFRDRHRLGERHPGHRDNLWVAPLR